MAQYDMMHYLSYRYGDKIAAHAFNALNAIGLPTPEDGEYVDGFRGAIVLHPNVGLVLRCVSNEKRLDHPLIVPEIGCAAQVGDFRMPLVVGLMTHKAGQVDAEWLQDRFHSEDIIVRDVTYQNIGLLPFGTPECPQGLPMVTDPDFIQRSVFARLMQWTKVLIHADPLDPVAYYCQLGAKKSDAEQWCHQISALQQAWQHVSPAPNVFTTSAAAENFWRLAERFTVGTEHADTQAMLRRGWMVEREKTSSIVKAYLFGGDKKVAEAADSAVAYAQRLSHIKTSGLAHAV